MGTPIPYDVIDSNELLASPREDEFNNMDTKDIFTNGRSCNVAGCDKVFRNTSNLIRHMRTHTGVRPYLCNVCGKAFGRSFTLSRHMRIHTGATPYACDHPGCDKRFNTSGNLSRHKRIHSGEKPYACSTESCEKRFSTAWKLKRHEKEVHSGDKRFFCAVNGCQKTFSSERTLAKHLRTHGESAVEEFRRSMTRAPIAMGNENPVRHQYDSRIPMLKSMPMMLPSPSPQQQTFSHPFKISTPTIELLSDQGRISTGYRSNSEEMYFQGNEGNGGNANANANGNTNGNTNGEPRFVEDRRNNTIDYQPLDRTCLEDLQELWLLDPAQETMIPNSEFSDHQRMDQAMSYYIMRGEKDEGNIEPLPLTSGALPIPSTNNSATSNTSVYQLDNEATVRYCGVNGSNQYGIDEGNSNNQEKCKYTNANQSDICIPMSPRQLYELARSLTSENL